MTYRYLVDIGNLLMEITEIFETEIMTGVHTHTQFMRQLGSFDKRGNGLLTIGGITRRIRFGIQFDTIGTRLGRPFYHRQI